MYYHEIETVLRLHEFGIHDSLLKYQITKIVIIRIQRHFKQSNRARLVPIIYTVLSLGRHELAFVGVGESTELNIAEPKENDGNFSTALRLRLKTGDSVLKEHLMSSGANTKYLTQKYPE